MSAWTLASSITSTSASGHSLLVSDLKSHPVAYSSTSPTSSSSSSTMVPQGRDRQEDHEVPKIGLWNVMIGDLFKMMKNPKLKVENSDVSKSGNTNNSPNTSPNSSSSSLSRVQNFFYGSSSADTLPTPKAGKVSLKPPVMPAGPLPEMMQEVDLRCVAMLQCLESITEPFKSGWFGLKSAFSVADG
jgi:hypothetical protein